MRMKRKSILWLIAVFLGFMSFVGIASQAEAFVFMDGDLKINGYIENQTAIRMEDQARDRGNDSGELSRCRTTMVLEAGLDLSESVKFNTILRGYYDAAWDLDSGIIQKPKEEKWDSAPNGIGMKEEFEVREYHFRKYWGNAVVKVGQQQIVWGESDLLRMSDIINPLDISHRIFLEDFENIRIPVRAIDFTYEFPGPKRFTVELVAIPEDFRTTRIASPGANWDPLAYRLPLTLSDPFLRAMEKDLNRIEDLGVENFQGGIRLKALFGEWDTSAFFFHKRAENAVAVSDEAVLNGMLPYIGPLVEAGAFSTIATLFEQNVDNIVDFEWPWTQTVGATFNVPEHYTGSIIRFESSFTFDQPFTVDYHISGMVDMLDDLLDYSYPQKVEFRLPDVDYRASDVLAFMIGFDRPTFIKFLNPKQTFFISGQLFQKYILDADDNWQTGLGKDGYDDHQVLATLIMSTEYLDGSITPQVAMMYDFTAESGLFWPKVTYIFNDQLHLEIGAVWIFADSGLSGDLGPFEKNDEAYVKLRYQF